MAKKIKFPGSRPIQISNDGVTGNLPGATPIEISTSGGPSSDGMLYEDGGFMLHEDGNYMVYE